MFHSIPLIPVRPLDLMSISSALGGFFYIYPILSLWFFFIFFSLVFYLCFMLNLGYKVMNDACCR